MRIALLLLLGVGGPALAANRLPPCPPPHPQLFLSPMGEPFRAAAGAPDPVGAWFARADVDHDGQISLAEMVADADRFFTALDVNGDGELLPDEVTRYERDVAPEVQLYVSRPNPFGMGARSERTRKRPSRKSLEYGGAMGAGRYAFLNIPEPVAAADADLNRAVDRDEFRKTAVRRFGQLDTARAGRLTLATLPRTPAQVAASDCDPTRVAEKTKGSRR